MSTSRLHKPGDDGDVYAWNTDAADEHNNNNDDGGNAGVLGSYEDTPTDDSSSSSVFGETSNTTDTTNTINTTNTDAANTTNYSINTSGSNINSPAIIGIAVVLGLSCLGFALMCLYRRKRKRGIKSKNSSFEESQLAYGGSSFASGQWKAQVPKGIVLKDEVHHHQKGEEPPLSPSPQPNFPHSRRLYKNGRLLNSSSNNNNNNHNDTHVMSEISSVDNDVFSTEAEPQQEQPQHEQPLPQQHLQLPSQPSEPQPLNTTSLSSRHILRPSVITREFQLPWSLPSPTKSEPTGSGRPLSILSAVTTASTAASAPPTPNPSTKKRRQKPGSSTDGTLPSTSSWLYRPPAVRIRSNQEQRPTTTKNLSRINTFGKKDPAALQTTEEPASPTSRLHQEPPMPTTTPTPLPTSATATAAHVVERMRGRRLINDTKGRLSAIPPHVSSRVALSSYSSSVDRESSYDASSLIDYYESAEQRASTRFSTS